MIGIKENVTGHADYEVDPTDSSVTRSDGKLKELFASAGLHIGKLVVVLERREIQMWSCAIQGEEALAFS